MFSKVYRLGLACSALIVSVGSSSWQPPDSLLTTSFNTPYHTTPYLTTQYLTIPHHILPQPHHTLLHQTTPHHIIPCYRHSSSKTFGSCSLRCSHYTTPCQAPERHQIYSWVLSSNFRPLLLPYRTILYIALHTTPDEAGDRLHQLHSWPASLGSFLLESTHSQIFDAFGHFVCEHLNPRLFFVYCLPISYHRISAMLHLHSNVCATW